MEFAQQLKEHQHKIEYKLGEYLDTLWPYGKIVDAMAYSLFAGGKRIRPILTLEACRFCGGNVDDAMDFACALEMVHTYSLIHDDLPCMDNDDIRRGKPTNHKVYGEDIAVLAGDALLTSAFEVIASVDNLTDMQIVKAIRCLSESAGVSGMVAGQVLDMSSNGQVLTAKQLEIVQSLKTGKLIVAAVQLGAIVANADEDKMKALTIYAQKIGLAFQIQDDMLDVEGTQIEIGKPVGSDIENEKATFVSIFGIDSCKQKIDELTREAIEQIRQYDNHEFLKSLALTLAQRNK